MHGSSFLNLSERQNHAREMIKTYDLDKIDGIVISSGDGLLYEVSPPCLGTRRYQFISRVQL